MAPLAAGELGARKFIIYVTPLVVLTGAPGGWIEALSAAVVLIRDWLAARCGSMAEQCDLAAAELVSINESLRRTGEHMRASREWREMDKERETYARSLALDARVRLGPRTTTS
jgi:hypothetical protein